MRKTWDDLAKIGTPDKWLKVYQHYQELLTQADALNWQLENGLIIWKEDILKAKECLLPISEETWNKFKQKLGI